MFNMARADIYRLLHSKGFYITEVVMFFLIGISISTSTLGVIIGNSDTLTNFQSGINDTSWTAVKSVSAMSSMASVLIYIILPLFIMTIGFDFSRQIYKNPLSSGMTRINYFISKYCIFLVICLLQFVFFYISVFFMSWIKNGLGDLTSHFFIKMLGTISIQFMEISAIFAISILILYLLFSTITSIIVTIITPAIPSVLAVTFKKDKWINNFNFQNNIDTAYPMHYSTGDMRSLIACAFGIIIICLLISFITFQRRDL